ncbi:hypothetical protein D3C76_1613270 [compost metagenome]
MVDHIGPADFCSFGVLSLLFQQLLQVLLLEAPQFLCCLKFQQLMQFVLFLP